MGHFIDDLSKRLANAPSRRDMLSITSRTFIAAFISSTWIGRLWANTTSTSAGGEGSSSCGAIQKAVQLAFPDPTKFNNHGGYVSSVAHSVSAAQNANLITNTCSECIVAQFGQNIPVGQQQACGTLVAPTQPCSVTGPPGLQIQTVGVLALAAFPNAWSDPQQWVLLIQLADAMLSCQVSPPTQQQSSVALTKTSAGFSLATTAAVVTQDSSTSCSTPGVNYCGPGNSLDISVAAGQLPTVAPCLNDGCFTHDNCYASDCISGACYWTEETKTCDASILAICLGAGNCSSTDLLQPATAFVCGMVKCLSGGNSGIPPLDSICKTQFLLRSALGCSQPASICQSCPPGESPCGDTCCPCGSTCANGSCAVCANGDTLCPSGGLLGGFTCCSPGTSCFMGVCCASQAEVCGTTCCPPPGVCLNGSCAVPCQSGETPCGNICCTATQNCSNGTCVTTTCPGEIPCGAACCPSTWTCCGGGATPVCAQPGQICCYGRNGLVFPCAAGTVCCGDKCATDCCAVNVNGVDYGCGPGTTCCGSGSNWVCCSTSDCGCTITSTGPACVGC